MKSIIFSISLLLIGCTLLLTGCQEDIVNPVVPDSIEYDSISIKKGMDTESTPKWLIDQPVGTANFSLQPEVPGVSIDSNTGKVNIEPNAELMDKTFTISVKINTTTALGGTTTRKFTGSIHIRVYEKSISGSLMYDDIGIAPGESSTANPKWDNANPEQTIVYSLKTTIPGVSVDSTTGKLSVNTGQKLLDTQVTVIATGYGTYGGEISSTFRLNVFNKVISGTLTYPGISIGLGESGTTDPIWEDAVSGQTLRYEISPVVNGVTVNSETGTVSVSSEADIMAQNFVVTAMGTAEYGGKITATIHVSVQQVSLTGTLHYDDMSILLGNTGTGNPQWEDAVPDQTVVYRISPNVTGISIDSATGLVSVDANTEPVNEDFTVTATGSGMYTGEISDTFRIVVRKDNISGALSYDEIVIEYGNAASREAQWTGELSGQTVSYSISPNVLGVTVDGVTGTVSVEDNVDVIIENFTVKASGTGSYVGEIEGRVRVIVQKAPLSGTLQYRGITLVHGKTDSQNPQWIGGKSGLTVNYNMTPIVSGVTINSNTGQVNVSADAAFMFQAFTIEATGTGNFSGSVTGTIQIVVHKAGIGNSLNYGDLTVALGNSGSQSPQWGNAPSGQTVTYTLSPSVTGVTINSATGDVSVGSNAGLMSRDFTVEATGTGNYAGKTQGTIHVVVQDGIGGSLNYSNISTEYGKSAYQNPQWTDVVSGQTVTYSIAPTVSGVTINSNSGRVSVSANAGIMDRSFTITATGTGSYVGTLTGTIRVNVQRTGISGTLSYSSLNVDSGNTGSQNPRWSGAKSGQTVRYSISPGGYGVSIDSSSGKVSVGTSASLMDRTFTITATGTGNYTGTKTGTIQIKVKTGISGTLRYNGISIEYGNSDYRNPQWSGAKSGQTVSYSISPSVSGVTVNSTTGRINVSTSAVVMDRSFTVTATGNGNYAGSITGTISVNVARTNISGTLRYNGISVERGSSDYQNPQWSGTKSGQTVSYRIDQPETGVSVNSNGRVSVSSSAPIMDKSIRVIASGTGNYQGEITGTIQIEVRNVPPAIPTGLRVTDKTTSSLGLAWDAASRAVEYQVRRNNSIVYTGGSTGYTDNGLSRNTNYSYDIRSKSATGLYSNWSSAVQFRTAKGADLTVSTSLVNSSTSIVAGTSIRFKYTVNNIGDMESSYPIHVSYYGSDNSSINSGDDKLWGGAIDDPIPAGGSRNLYQTIAPRTRYYGAIVDPVSGEFDTSNNTSNALRINAKLPTPTGLRSTSTSTSSISLSWNSLADVGDVDVTRSPGFEYELRRDRSVVYRGTGTSYRDSGLSSDTEYTYDIRAVDDNNETSDWSPDLDVRTDEPARLWVDSISVNPSSINLGDEIRITATIENFGGTTSSSSKSYFTFYESSNDTISDGDTEIGDGWVRNVAPGESIDVDFYYTPNNSGTFYYGAIFPGEISTISMRVEVTDPDDHLDYPSWADNVEINFYDWDRSTYEDGRINTGSDLDYFKVVFHDKRNGLFNKSKLRLYTTGSVDTELKIFYGPNTGKENEVIVDEYSSGYNDDGNGNNFDIDITMSEGLNSLYAIYLEISSYGSDTGDYRLHFEWDY